MENKYINYKKKQNNVEQKIVNLLKTKSRFRKTCFLNFCVYTGQILWYNTDTEKEIIIICSPKNLELGAPGFLLG